MESRSPRRGRRPTSESSPVMGSSLSAENLRRSLKGKSTLSSRSPRRGKRPTVTTPLPLKTKTSSSRNNSPRERTPGLDRRNASFGSLKAGLPAAPFVLGSPPARRGSLRGGKRLPGPKQAISNLPISPLVASSTAGITSASATLKNPTSPLSSSLATNCYNYSHKFRRLLYALFLFLALVLLQWSGNQGDLAHYELINEDLVVISKELTTNKTIWSPFSSSSYLPEQSPTAMGPDFNHTVSVFIDMRAGWKDWGFSYFATDQLQLYGRLRYETHWFHFTKETQKLEEMSKASSHCLVVSNPKGLEEIRQAHAPNCKTWIINDEYCEYSGEIRFYHHQSKATEQIFVPLGPRYDFYEAYQKRQEATISDGQEWSIPKASDRGYIFNAIFSKSTSPSRKELKHLLLNATDQYTIQDPDNYFIRIPAKWRRQMHPKFHIQSPEYVEILLKSRFTLSPNGHNPECFRLYESMLLGSIPIIVLDDEEYKTHACANALQPLLDFELPVVAGASQTAKQHPFVILSSWKDLNATMTELHQQGSEALDARQNYLLQWYEAFMKSRVYAVEDLLLK